MPTTIREQIQEIEKQVLSEHACLSSESRGRLIEEDPCNIRTPFQRDRDRIIHSKSFRRMKHKTQVFLSPTNDHFRTRLTHVIEVSQIARTISRALFLNEDLTEAIALSHDLGHTPFGHAGEDALNEVYEGGFKHVIHSLRLVDILENNGKGLNLTYEVRDGISKHSKGMGPVNNPDIQPSTMEGQVVRISDLVAYANHDLDDAIRSGIITINDVPGEYIEFLGSTSSERINKLVNDIISETLNKNEGKVFISNDSEEVILSLRQYLFNTVYMNEKIRTSFQKAKKVIRELFYYFCVNEEKFREFYGKESRDEDSLERSICDFIAGMTDSYALSIYEKIFLPRRWEAD